MIDYIKRKLRKLLTGHERSALERNEIRFQLDTVVFAAQREGWDSCWLCCTSGAQMLREVYDIDLRALNERFMVEKYGLKPYKSEDSNLVISSAYPVHTITDRIYGKTTRSEGYDETMAKVRKELYAFWYKEITGDTYLFSIGDL